MLAQQLIHPSVEDDSPLSASLEFARTWMTSSYTTRQFTGEGSLRHDAFDRATSSSAVKTS
jgi:hypothetical protein